MIAQKTIKSTEVTTKEMKRTEQAEVLYYVHQYIANSTTKPMQNQMLVLTPP